MFARWPRPSFYLVAAAVLALDQITKAWTVASLLPGETVALIPGFFNLTYVQNTGVAFGLFRGEGFLVALLVIALALGALYYTRGVNWARWMPNLVGGGIAGGALGNLLDRSRLGYVVDFLDVHLGAAPLAGVQRGRQHDLRLRRVAGGRTTKSQELRA
ncbi:MAG: signal peptidase II [Verrucomicrobiota bacterium]